MKSFCNEVIMSIDDIRDLLPTRDGCPVAGKAMILHEIGRGGMGVVYAGWHEDLDIPVAIKFLQTPDERREEFLSRFRREARILASIDEPNLLKVFDFGSIDDIHYLIMEWVSGRSLDGILKGAGPFTEVEVTTILRDVGQALLGLHTHGIIHRDIKPANLLLRARDGRVKLADLGLAKRVSGQSVHETTVDLLGTPAFMSPEQLADPATVDSASDIFSLASTAFTLLTGHVPFSATTLWELITQILTHPFPDVRTYLPGVSDSMVKIFEKMTEKERGKRIHDAGELLGILPDASLPFRAETLTAAKPVIEVKRPGKGPGAGTHPEKSMVTERRLSPGSAIPSLLFCLCLQNDFIAPVGRGEKLPNRMHIGWSESMRIVGADPSKGPLVSFLRDAFACGSTRVVFIRDWHDPHDPMQHHELDFFGSHCTVGSWGARFIDVIEGYSRDRRRSAVLDSIGLNDFEHTPMEEIIEALLMGESREKVPVGVIGVWTDVKVNYLLYELRTRARFQNLATCSSLVASPNRAAHQITLKHLEEMLGVRVYHSAEDFLSFLKGPTVFPRT